MRPKVQQYTGRHSRHPDRRAGEPTVPGALYLFLSALSPVSLASCSHRTLRRTVFDRSGEAGQPAQFMFVKREWEGGDPWIQHVKQGVGRTVKVRCMQYPICE